MTVTIALLLALTAMAVAAGVIVRAARSDAWEQAIYQDMREKAALKRAAESAREVEG